MKSTPQRFATRSAVRRTTSLECSDGMTHPTKKSPSVARDSASGGNDISPLSSSLAGASFLFAFRGGGGGGGGGRWQVSVLSHFSPRFPSISTPHVSHI